MTWITFSDAEDSNAIESGELIYAFVTSLSMGNSNLMTPNNIPLQDWDIVDGETVGNNYERRKPYISYTGMNQNVFTIKGKWTSNIATGVAVGATVKINGTDERVLTPHRMVRMFHSGHKFYMKDSLIYNSLYNDGVESLYPLEGIPIVIKDFKLNTESNKEGQMTFSMTVFEDKVSDI